MGSGKDRKKERDRKRDKKEKAKKRKRERYSSSSESDYSSDSEDDRRRDAAKMVCCCFLLHLLITESLFAYTHPTHQLKTQAKKVERHLKKHASTTTAAPSYDDGTNPFGAEVNLTERFVWGKKIEKQLVEGADVRDLTARAEQRRHLERMDEIAKVQKRREERERERAALAEELEMIQRERAMAEAVELERKEEDFHLEQAKVRAQQRLTEGRPKAIDIITNSLFLLDTSFGFDDTDGQDPATIVSNLNVWQLKELKNDVAEMAELDVKNLAHAPFWAALAIVTDHELATAQKQDAIDRARVRGEPIPRQYLVREAGWHSSLDAEVEVMLAGKRHGELEKLGGEIQEQLDSGEAADPEYWAAVLRRLQVYKAKALVREMHGDMMHAHVMKDAGMVGKGGSEGGSRRAEQMMKAAAERQQQHDQEVKEEKEGNGVENALEKEENNKNVEEIEVSEDGDEELEALAAVDTRLEKQPPSTTTTAIVEDEWDGEPRAWEDLSEDEQQFVVTIGGGGLSPKPLPPEYVVGHDVVHEEDDMRMLELLRAQAKAKETERFKEAAAAAAAAAATAAGGRSAEAERVYRRMVANPSAPVVASSSLYKNAVAQQQQGGGGVETAEEARFKATANRAMGNLDTSGDAPFGGEVSIESQVYWWHEKYRPRKPKYFNRVHTGYDWNKYNKTHYDADNPPPKTVQGYKFNIFYPDLIDPSKAPTYDIERDPESGDGSTCIIRFSAGPPYEDIAFRIVNKDWELNPKRGFKCVFDHGILHLYFNLKRQFYRR